MSIYINREKSYLYKYIYFLYVLYIYKNMHSQIKICQFFFVLIKQCLKIYL